MATAKNEKKIEREAKRRKDGEREYETVKSNLTRWMTRLNRLTSFLLIKFVRGARESMSAHARTHVSILRDLTRLKKRGIDTRRSAYKMKTKRKIKSKLAFFRNLLITSEWYILYLQCVYVRRLPFHLVGDSVLFASFIFLLVLLCVLLRTCVLCAAYKWFTLFQLWAPLGTK